MSTLVIKIGGGEGIVIGPLVEGLPEGPVPGIAGRQGRRPGGRGRY